MPIQTSKVTTGSNGDLSLDPNGTGKVVLTDEIGAVKPLGVNSDGQIEELNNKLAQAEGKFPLMVGIKIIKYVVELCNSYMYP